ncbi:MAG: N-acetylmuramic acid 6-phosphate etherase [Phycisphaeraceae bacterium]
MDRSDLVTERRNSETADIDAMSVEDALRAINVQDQVVPGVVGAAVPAIARLVERIVTGIRRGGRLIYVGAGTSGRLGVLDASECSPTFHCDPEQVVGVIAGGETALRRSSEGKEDDGDGSHAALTALQLTERDTVVGIAAGGTTPYVWGAIDFARKRGSATAIVTCTPLAELPADAQRPEVDHAIELPVGPEAIAGSTRMKAGTATKLALNMISTTVMIQLGKTWGNLMVDLRASNAKLRERAVSILTQQTDLTRDAAARLLDDTAGSVKLALVMARLNLTADEARRQLDASQGHLRPLLGPPREDG